MIEALIHHGTIHTAENDGLLRGGHHLLRQNGTLDLFAVFIDDLRDIVDLTFHTFPQDNFLAGGQGVIFQHTGLEGDGLVIFLRLQYHTGDLNDHAVIGGGIQCAGEGIGRGKCDVQRLQNVFHIAAVRADDIDLIAVFHGDHLYAGDMDFGDSIRYMRGVGV